MNSLEIITNIQNFPIGGFPEDKMELLSKAEIISFLARFQDQFSSIENVDERELTVRNFLSDLLVLNEGEVMPSLGVASKNLNLSSGFIQDYDKIQYIKETNPNFDKMYDSLATSLGLTSIEQKKLM